jgi:hypothetical protein
MTVGKTGRKLLVFAAILTFAALVSGTANGAVKDPRRCEIKGTVGSPLYCASRAARAVVKARMVARTHNPRWNLTVICSAEVVSQPLHQNCHWFSDHGRSNWGATVVFAATSAGWAVHVTIKGPVPA